MEIDSRVEPLLRQILYGVVRRDEEIMGRAIDAIPDADTANQVSQLALAVTLQALHEIHAGTPTSEQLDSVAAKIAEYEAWINVSPDEVRTFLKAPYDGQPPHKVVTPDDSFYLAFIIAGSLLSAGHKDDEEWWTFLDRTESAIEQAP